MQSLSQEIFCLTLLQTNVPFLLKNMFSSFVETKYFSKNVNPLMSDGKKDHPQGKAAGLFKHARSFIAIFCGKSPCINVQIQFKCLSNRLC